MNFDGPLLFEPIYQTRVWGGRRLASELGRELPDDDPIGESWELVDRPEAMSVVANGPAKGMTLSELWTGYRVQVFGSEALSWGKCRFPILVKVLDCNEALSIQVHPPVEQARLLGGEPKTEMWFVAKAEKGSSLVAGLKAGVTQEKFETALRSGTVADCVHHIEPQYGDSLFVPSGRLHALGGGLLIYEVQQNSDTTYRVFDWNRVGLDGKARALHVAESMQCIDFTDIEPEMDHGKELIAECDFFKVTHCLTGTPRMIMAIKSTNWAGVEVSPGRVAIWPACLPECEPQGEWLELELPAAP